jgi:hypothetical protein
MFKAKTNKNMNLFENYSKNNTNKPECETIKFSAC